MARKEFDVATVFDKAPEKPPAAPKVDTSMFDAALAVVDMLAKEEACNLVLAGEDLAAWKEAQAFLEKIGTDAAAYFKANQGKVQKLADDLAAAEKLARAAVTAGVSGDYLTAAWKYAAWQQPSMGTKWLGFGSLDGLRQLVGWYADQGKMNQGNKQAWLASLVSAGVNEAVAVDTPILLEGIVPANSSLGYYLWAKLDKQDAYKSFAYGAAAFAYGKRMAYGMASAWWIKCWGYKDTGSPSLLPVAFPPMPGNDAGYKAMMKAWRHKYVFDIPPKWTSWSGGNTAIDAPALQVLSGYIVAYMFWADANVPLQLAQTNSVQYGKNGKGLQNVLKAVADAQAAVDKLVGLVAAKKQALASLQAQLTPSQQADLAAYAKLAYLTASNVGLVQQRLGNAQKRGKLIDGAKDDAQGAREALDKAKQSSDGGGKQQENEETASQKRGQANDKNAQAAAILKESEEKQKQIAAQQAEAEKLKAEQAAKKQKEIDDANAAAAAKQKELDAAKAAGDKAAAEKAEAEKAAAEAAAKQAAAEKALADKAAADQSKTLDEVAKTSEELGKKQEGQKQEIIATAEKVKGMGGEFSEGFVNGNGKQPAENAQDADVIIKTLTEDPPASAFPWLAVLLGVGGGVAGGPVGAAVGAGVGFALQPKKEAA